SIPPTHFFRSHHQVRQQSNRGAARNRTKLETAFPEEPGKQPLAPSLQAVWYITGRDADIRQLSRAVDEKTIREYRVVFSFFRPKHLLNRILKRVQAVFNRRIPVEFSHAVVQQKWRSGPDTDQRGRTREAATTSRHHVGLRFAGHGIVNGDRA